MPHGFSHEIDVGWRDHIAVDNFCARIEDGLCHRVTELRQGRDVSGFFSEGGDCHLAWLEEEEEECVCVCVCVCVVTGFPVNNEGLDLYIHTNGCPKN